QTQEQEAQRLNELRDDVAAREKNLTEARRGSEALEQKVIDLQRSLAQYESDRAKAEAERAAAQEREAELKAAQVRLGQEAEQVELLRQEWQKTLGDLNQEVEGLRQQFHNKNQAYKQEEEKGRAEQGALLALQKELEQAKARLLELVRL